MTKFQMCVSIDSMLDRLGVDHISYKNLGSYYPVSKIKLLYDAFFNDDFVIEIWDNKFHGFHRKFAKITNPNADDNLITVPWSWKNKSVKLNNVNNLTPWEDLLLGSNNN